uniref:Right handed beta helix domain-containing protein n=1 Tax=Amphimedon queenslandica TaxID=400682 RepID=A0A1X7TIZ0_AMPQE
MSLLLVVVLLFFSSSCSDSFHQYYVSDDCTSVTSTPCNPLSVYARHMSKYSNSIFYLIGNSSIRNHDINITAVKNVTLHGLDQSCLIYDNINEGLCINGTFLRSTQIDIIDTELIGNGGNKILNSLSNSISLSNVTVANSTSTGLALARSLVTIKNNLIFRNNTGVVGGGLAINDSSVLTLTSSANLEFIDNYASYKGGGIYIEESSDSDIILIIPNMPLTLINNTAGLVGGDMYGYHRSFLHEYRFKLTNQHISSTNNAMSVRFCDPINSKRHTFLESNQHIFPGQALKMYVTLLGKNYFGRFSPTIGILKLYGKSSSNSTFTLVSQKYVNNTCSLIKYTPYLTQTRIYHIRLSVYNNPTYNFISFDYIVNECPIGFSTSSSQGSCTCSQSVSRENVTCDINSLNITHNGLLWIGTYHTSTPFNANETNPNACIINEDCLLYCSPNPVTFKLNHTDIQCVDNRGQRMCGSCRVGYSLLMGSNKCGHCHNNYMMIAWIALFAVMGVLLVVLLIALNLTVSVGTLNGLLFYANIVKLYEPVFSRKGALPVLSQIISWINLDFGFEICFYNGMDNYAKQWLQRYGKISRLMGSHAVPVLSTLFLLSYTKLVRTIVIVLHKREVTLHCTNESVKSVSLWYEDPNFEYGKGKHAGLFGFALLVTVFFVIPYTLFFLLNPFYEKYLSNLKVFKKFWSRFKPIIDAYSGTMKDEYRFWPGLLLVARIPVLLSVTLVDSFIQSQHFLLSMLLTVLVIVLSLGYCFGGVYKKRMNNLSHMKCYDALIKKLLKKQDEDDAPLLDLTESHKTVDQQKREIVPSSTDVRHSASRESVVELF